MVNIYIGRYMMTLTKLQFCYVVTLKTSNFVTTQQKFRYVVTLVFLSILQDECFQLDPSTKTRSSDFHRAY